jgi:replicative DNA helicase
MDVTTTDEAIPTDVEAPHIDTPKVPTPSPGASGADEPPPPRAHELLEQILEGGAGDLEAGSPLGVDTGLADLDATTMVLRRQELIVLAARPGMGKTAMASGIAAHVALREQLPVFYCSTATAPATLLQRLLAAEAKVDLADVRRCAPGEASFPAIRESVERLGRAPLYIEGRRHPTVRDIRRRAERVMAQVGQLGLLVIDDIHGITPEPGIGRCTQKELSSTLKDLAVDLDVPILVVSQVSAEVDRRWDGCPSLVDLPGPDGLESNADTVLFLSGEGSLRSGKPPRLALDLVVAKHRNGPTGCTKLLFYKEQLFFTNDIVPSRRGGLRYKERIRPVAPGVSCARDTWNYRESWDSEPF